MTGNFVGVGRDASPPSFANETGISVTASGNTIGPENTVAGNSDNGVEISGESNGGNRIVANSIHDNGGKGIALVSGANGGLQAPVLSSAILNDGTTTVSGTITGPSGLYFVEFFRNTSCDAPAAGEGETYLGSTNVTVPAGKNSVHFTQDLSRRSLSAFRSPPPRRAGRPSILPSSRRV